MKLLHTADLHLGKSLHEMPLLQEQEKILKDILHILQKDQYAALLIAGDIYDRAIPPAEALSLFSWFLSEIRTTCPDTAVFIIPGNHDSAQRLAFADTLLKNQHIYIAENTTTLGEPVIISHAEEQAAVFMLPFLHIGSFLPQKSCECGRKGDSQAEMAGIASEILKKAVNPALPSILLAHLFTLGGKTASSERPFIGTAEYIDPSLFSFFTYTALGHLHRFQKVTDRMFYAGSPLAYAFDEADDQKYVVSVTIDCRTPGFPLSVEPIPLTPIHRLRRLEGTFADFFEGTAYEKYAHDFLEITLTNSQVITNPMQLLRSRFPFLLTIRQRSFVASIPVAPEQMPIAESAADTVHSILEHFITFEEYISTECISEKKELFEALCKEAEYET